MTILKSRPVLLIGSATVVTFLWHFIATRYFRPELFPGPLQVLNTGLEMLLSGELADHVSISMQRIWIGFFAGSLIAIPLGLLMGVNRTIRTIFEPYSQFLRFIPAIAWITPVIIWFGIGELSKVLLIMYTTIFIVLINTMVGVTNISQNKIRAAQSLGASPLQAFIYMTLPAALPFALTGMRLAMGNSFMTVVSAEMLAAESGLGYLIFNARLWMATDQIFIGIACLGALGILTDWGFRYAIRRFGHQYGPVE